MTELLIIRHGETEWNAGEIYRGRADIGLNEHGILQAKLLAGYLADAEIEAVYASPLQRAGQTAEGLAVARSLKVRVEQGLTDFHYGEWQGMAREEVRTIYRRLSDAWERTPEAVTMPGGECLDDVKKRVEAVIGRIVKRHKGTVAIVSHRVVNKVIICSLLGLGLDRFRDIRVDTCGITTFSIDKGRAILTGHNDISFLKNAPIAKLADF